MSFEPPSIEVFSRGETTVLVLRGNLSLADASALREAAVTLSIAGANAGEAPSGGMRSGVCLDLREVESVDVGILQIWAALDAEFVLRSRPLLVEGISEPLRSQWEAAGWCGFACAG